MRRTREAMRGCGASESHCSRNVSAADLEQCPYRVLGECCPSGGARHGPLPTVLQNREIPCLLDDLDMRRQKFVRPIEMLLHELRR
jgi:hypothetical protein